MHHVYTTPAFIVRSWPHGEAGKFLLLFTRDFGMIRATAQGIRLSQSKLRYHIQDTQLSEVSVVRGKDVWRLTGAHEISGLKYNSLHVKILHLLHRLLHGEEKNEELFSILESLYRQEINEADEQMVECLTVLRILNTLGYIRPTEDLKIFLHDASLSPEILEAFRPLRSRIVAVINAALAESHL